LKSIAQIPNIFPEELAEQLLIYVNNVPWHYGWASNKAMGYSHWNFDFAKADQDNGLDVADRLPPILSLAWKYLQKEHLGEQDLLRCYTNAHTFGVEGYPHTDSRRDSDETIVVYLNPEWRREWGGETMVYDSFNPSKIVHAELPQFNRALRFFGDQTHTARSVSRICPTLRMTLMFKFAPKNVDPTRNKIQKFLMEVKANEINHSNGTLMKHLLLTYDAIKANGWDDTLACAGGLHSIFGTNIFKTQTITPDQRDQVVDIIGEEATRLVELFRDVKRPATLEQALANKTTTVEMNAGGARILDLKDLNSLCVIEAANLADQGSLKNYPNICKFLKNNRNPE